jgi:hypothetical protein
MIINELFIFGRVCYWQGIRWFLRKENKIFPIFDFVLEIFLFIIM